jgi:hypothetical protein
MSKYPMTQVPKEIPNPKHEEEADGMESRLFGVGAWDFLGYLGISSSGI